MNVDLLSELLEKIVLSTDEVTLPGFGSFVAEEVPAFFSDKGYTINPPYRKIAFRPYQGEDQLLVEAYSASKEIPRSEAKKDVESFFYNLKENLKAKKTVVLPGLGKFRATKENNFFFVCDADLDIYPDGFGLESVSLRSRSKTRVVPPPSSSAEEGRPSRKKYSKPMNTRYRRKMSPVLKILIWILVLIALVLGTLFALKYYAPDILEKILYTEEELMILKL